MEKLGKNGLAYAGTRPERLLLLTCLFFAIIAVSSLLSLAWRPAVGGPRQDSRAITGYALFPSPLPDLAASVTVDNPVKTGESVLVSVKTANVGAGAAGASTTFVSTDAGGKTFGIPALKAGESVTRKFAYYCTAPGRHPLSANPDIHRMVKESDERNSFNAAVDCVGDYAKPDLKSRFARTTGGIINAVTRQNVTIYENTSNTGLGFAQPSATRVYQDNRTLAVFPKPGLASGASAGSNFTYYCGRFGTFLLSTKADYDNRVSEVNEADNIGVVYVICG